MATLYAQDARAARQERVKGMRPGTKTRFAGDMVVCKECFAVKTRHPSGNCSNCREREEPALDAVLDKYVAQLRVPFPEEFKGRPVPCQDRKEFLRPNASQQVRETCWSCHLYEWCLDWGTANDEEGIWGGLSRPERKRVREGKLTKRDYILVA